MFMQLEGEKINKRAMFLQKKIYENNIIYMEDFV